MNQTVTLLHAADLHLGAPFCGLRGLSPAWADRLLRALPEAFERVIDAALDNAVDFVVFAGDTFDKAQPSYGDYMQFVDGVARLGAAGIPVYLVTGNHDPLCDWRRSYADLPENLHIFPADQVGYFLYERDGLPLVSLAGRSFAQAAWPADEDAGAGLSAAAAQEALGVQTPFSVAVLHTGIDRDAATAPLSPARMRAGGMDYWALGHFHKPEIVDASQGPRIAYSGCIQGRALDETGPRGINLVTLAPGQPNGLRRISTASVLWERIDLDISLANSLEDVVSQAADELRASAQSVHSGQVIARVTLCGSTSLRAALQRPGLLEELRTRITAVCPQALCESVVDATALPLDLPRLRAEGLFPAAFLRACDAAAGQRAEERRLLEEAFTALGTTVPAPEFTDAELAELDDEAQDMVLELLSGGAR